MGSRSQGRGRSRLTARLMRIVLLGATGMVGAGAARSAGRSGRGGCAQREPAFLRRPAPQAARAVAAGPLRLRCRGKATDWVGRLRVGCRYQLGGLDEPADAKVAEELTLRWARALLRLNPVFSFCYCSAAGADGGSMWARVRRRVEAALEAMPFRYSGCVRPGFITGARNPLPGEGLPGLHRVVPAAVPAAGPSRSALATTSEGLGALCCAWSRARPGATSSNPRTSTASARDPLLARASARPGCRAAAACASRHENFACPWSNPG